MFLQYGPITLGLPIGLASTEEYSRKARSAWQAAGGRGVLRDALAAAASRLVAQLEAERAGHVAALETRLVADIDVLRTRDAIRELLAQPGCVDGFLAAAGSATE